MPEGRFCSGRSAFQLTHRGWVVVGAEEARDGRNGNRKTHDVILKEKAPWGKQAGGAGGMKKPARPGGVAREGRFGMNPL